MGLGFHVKIDGFGLDRFKVSFSLFCWLCLNWIKRKISGITIFSVSCPEVILTDSLFPVWLICSEKCFFQAEMENQEICQLANGKRNKRVNMHSGMFVWWVQIDLNDKIRQINYFF